MAKLKNILTEVFEDTQKVDKYKVVEGVKIKNNQTGEESSIEATGFFVAIGHKPNTDIFKGQFIEKITSIQQGHLVLVHSRLQLIVFFEI